MEPIRYIDLVGSVTATLVMLVTSDDGGNFAAQDCVDVCGLI